MIYPLQSLLCAALSCAVKLPRAHPSSSCAKQKGSDRCGIETGCHICYTRGIGAYQFLDLVPNGRDEAGLQGPQDWVRHHDRDED